MVGADFHVLVLFRHLAADVQLASLWVEIDGCDPDEERYVHACGGGAAGRGLGRHSTDG